MTLEGKVAVVTGAAQGIGREYAHAFARGGAKVVVADIQAEGAERVAKEIEGAGGEALAVTVDVSDEPSTLAMAAAAKERFGTVHILVNNAAIYHSMRLEGQMTVPIDYWRKVFGVNLDGALLCTRAVAPMMIGQSWGRVIIQSSDAAFLGYGGHYSVSKLALVGLTAGFARELGGKGITVNCVCPGIIDTEATRSVTPEPVMKMLRAQQAIAKIGEPSDLVGLVLFLCSDEASWITGQAISADGGLVMRM